MIPVATATRSQAPHISGVNTFAVQNTVSSPASTQPATNFQPATFQAPKQFSTRLNTDATQFNSAGRTQSANNPFSTANSPGVNKLQAVQPKFGFLPDFGIVSIPAAIAALCCCCCCALPVLLMALPFIGG